MKYSVCLLLFVYSYSYGMLEMFSPLVFFPVPRSAQSAFSSPTQTVEYELPLQFNQCMKIADDKERRDAKFFIACLDGFKGVAEKTLEKYKDGYAKLSDREVAFFKFCIEINDITRYKVDENRCAVYKQLCSLYLSTPTVNMPALRLWRTLLSKKKIDQPLFDEQFEQTKKLHTFINDLITEGLICRYPRSVGEKVVYKAAL